MKGYRCELCADAEAEFFADNNLDRNGRWYCAACEERRAEKWGCALILSEGATCENGICGCGGTGVYL